MENPRYAGLKKKNKTKKNKKICEVETWLTRHMYVFMTS